MTSPFLVDNMLAACKKVAGLKFDRPSNFELHAALDNWAPATDADLADLLFKAAPGLSWTQGASKSGQGSWTQGGRRLSDADVSVFFLALSGQVSEFKDPPKWAHLALRTLRNERALKQTVNFAKRVSVARGVL